MKAESETRWSARADAVRPIHENVGDLVQLLDTIGSDTDETTNTRSEVTQLLSRILTFDFFAALSSEETAYACMHMGHLPLNRSVTDDRVSHSASMPCMTPY